MVQSLELLVGKDNVLSGALQVNATNSMGLTALNILDIVREEPNDIHIRKILQNARCDLTEEPSKDWFKYFKFQLKRDSPSDTRNVLLVVAALIASITFQAGLNPSSALPQNSHPPPPLPPPPPAILASAQVSSRDVYRPALLSGINALSSILGMQATTLNLFLFGNSFALTASLSIIIYLTVGFPFQRELLMAIFSMKFAYGCSAYSLTKKDNVASALVSVAFILNGISISSKFYKELRRKWLLGTGLLE
ncbi:hypothetical protein PTKIN_Ptkin15bG0011800 [Pterospermum kingtungense]